MLIVLFCLLVIFGILVVSEYFWRHKILQGERARKFVHVLAGVFVAFWPWFMSWQAIQLISIAFIVVVYLNHRFKLFHALMGVRRRTIGDYLFGVAVGMSALLTSNKTIFMIAILHLALADGLAAVIGKRYGRSWAYTILGQQKTLVGSMAFWLISLGILGTSLLFANHPSLMHPYVGILIFLPPVLTALENISPYGLDNIIIPFTVVVTLQLLV